MGDSRRSARNLVCCWITLRRFTVRRSFCFPSLCEAVRRLPPSRYCCSAACGADCGGPNCASARNRALNISEVAGTSPFKLPDFNADTERDEHDESANDAGHDSDVQCCPEMITRSCLDAQDTACILERAPARHFKTEPSGPNVRGPSIASTTFPTIILYL